MAAVSAGGYEVEEKAASGDTGTTHSDSGLDGGGGGGGDAVATAGAERRGGSSLGRDEDVEVADVEAVFRVTVAESDCPRMTVDLDLPPERRWREVVEAFREHLPPALVLVDELLGTGLAASAVTSFFSGLTKVGGVFFSDELKAIADQVGVGVGRVALLQIAYEAFAACTSIVVEAEDGTPQHIRTMDWEMPALERLTVVIDFQRGGSTVYSATTWAGYVGVLTGMRPGAFSVSVNYRRLSDAFDWGGTKGILKNAVAGASSAWPIGFLLRVVLDEDETYDAAVGSIEASKLMAPVYVTVAGTLRGEGRVITRGRSEAEPRVDLTTDAPICQVNMDHWRVDADKPDDDWQDICDSRTRRAIVMRYLANLGHPPTLDELWTLMRIPPVLAHDCVYTVSMVPRTGHYLTQVQATDELIEAAAAAATARANPEDKRRTTGGATRQ